MIRPIWLAMGFVGSGLFACGSDSDESFEVVVVGESGDQRAEGIMVQVDDSDWVTTDAEGRASFPGHGSPEVLRVDTAAFESTRHEVQVIPHPSSSPYEVAVRDVDHGWREATITGTVRGVPEGAKVVVFYLGHRGVFNGSAIAEQGGADAAYELRAPWNEQATTLPATLVALAVDGQSPPRRYTHFGTATVDITDGGTSSVDLTLAPVEQGRIQGSVELPAGIEPGTMDVMDLFLSLVIGDRAFLLGRLDLDPGAPAFDLAVPKLPGARASVFVSATIWHQFSSRLERDLEIPTTGASFELLAPLDLIEPADGIIVHHSSPFRWEAPASGAPSTLHVFCYWDVGRASYRIGADVGEATLPSIPGIVIPPGTECQWGAERAEGELSGTGEGATSVSRTFIYAP